MKDFTITIFGSSLPQPGDEEYTDAYYIAKQLARNGFNICSGGALGIMDAVSKGASEEGKEAIGITVSIFNSPSNIYLTKEIRCDTLSQRLDNLVSNADGFVILPGGTGTLLELALIWELINKDVLDYKPIACLGNMWANIVREMENRVRIEKRKENIIRCFDKPNQIIEFIKESFNGKTLNEFSSVNGEKN